MRSEPVTFSNKEGETLAGILEWPVGPPQAFAVFAHCFACSKESKAAAYISRALAAKGFAVLRFDFTGLGASEGEFATSGFTSNIADVVAAAAYLREQHQAPALLVGHSLGGAAVLAAGPQIDEVSAVGTIGAPAGPERLEKLLGTTAGEVREKGEASFTLGGRQVTLKPVFFDDLKQARQIDSLGGRALLVMHSPADDIVDIADAEAIYKSVRGYKSFITLADANHLLTDRADAEYVATVLSAWSTRYLPPAAADKPEGEGDVRVEEWDKPYTNRIWARDHTALADEPAKVGGLDAGFTPYELLLAALGACTSMTLRMYANRKEWPLEKVTVYLHHDKIHAEDCDECERKEGKIDRLDKIIDIQGDLDDDQRQRLLEIAEKCPVNRTLQSEKQIRSKLKED